mgnify:CR=1 FL=1
MNTVKQITRKLKLLTLGCATGKVLVASNVIEHGDYATVCFFSDIYDFIDHAEIDVVNNMSDAFKNQSAINQVKAKIRSINPTVRFSDEKNAPIVPSTDDDLYTKTQVKDAMKAFDCFGKTPTKEHRSIIAWASRKGYVTSFSYTQKYWTDAGVDWVRA